MPEPLSAISTIIELKPGKKYLLVFTGDLSREQLDQIVAMLHAMEIDSLGIALRKGEALEVIEVPND